MANSDIDGCKSRMRTRLKRIRSSIPVDEREGIDNAIAGRFLSTAGYEQAAVIQTYLSFGAEVDTRIIIGRAWRDGKVVALPRCVPHTRQMQWHVVRSLDHLVRSPFGVDEPADDPSTLLPEGAGPAIAIVPALTFDAAGYRLGYGGGFYDTFLERFVGTSVGLCREVQMSDDLASLGILDIHDRAVDVVVTEVDVR